MVSMSMPIIHKTSMVRNTPRYFLCFFIFLYFTFFQKIKGLSILMALLMKFWILNTETANFYCLYLLIFFFFEKRLNEANVLNLFGQLSHFYHIQFTLHIREHFQSKSSSIKELIKGLGHKMTQGKVRDVLIKSWILSPENGPQ